MINNYPVVTTGMDYSHLIVTGEHEDDFFVTDIISSEAIITIAQVEQALHDEAEAGRIHGNGLYVNGCWENGSIRINLNRQWYFCGSNVPLRPGNIAPSIGQPYIEAVGIYGNTFGVNADWKWNTIAPCLRMSSGMQTNYSAKNLYGGCTDYEFANAIILQKKFGLSGCWGGKNRVAETSCWYEDRTLLNYPAEQYWNREFVYDSENIPRHSIILQGNGKTVVILPEIMLHRHGFVARRMFWLSEKTHYPIRFGNGISGTVYATLSLPIPDLASDDLFLCFPGGANAVDICDLTLIRRAKKVNLLILNKQGLEGWKFAKRFAARLQKEGIGFSIKLLTGYQSKVLSLKKFRQHLCELGLTIPAELSDDFAGRLNTYMEHRRRDLIPGILGKGEVMLITGDCSVEVAFYLATSVKHGCWDGRWRHVKRNCKITLFVDKYSLAKVEKTKIPTGVDIRSGDILLENAKQAVSKCGLVIFASRNMQNDKTRFHEVLEFCQNQDISAIVFSAKPDQFIEQITERIYSIRYCSENYTLASRREQFGIRFSLNSKGQLLSCCNLEEQEIVELDSNSRCAEADNGMNDFNKSISNIPQGQIFNSIEDLIGN